MPHNLPLSGVFCKCTLYVYLTNIKLTFFSYICSFRSCKLSEFVMVFCLDPFHNKSVDANLDWNKTSLVCKLVTCHISLNGQGSVDINLLKHVHLIITHAVLSCTNKFELNLLSLNL